MGSNIVVCVYVQMYFFKCEYVPITISTIDAAAQDLPDD